MNCNRKNIFLSKAKNKHCGYGLKVFLLCLFSVATFHVFAQDNYEIRKIKFSGNKTLDKSDLLDHISFKQSNIIQRWIQRKDPSLYNDEMMDLNLERLTRYYQSEGFMHATVRLDSLEINEKKRTLNIRIRIEENNPVKVDSINIAVTDTVINIQERRLQRRMNRRLDLTPGSRFIDESLYADMTKLNNILNSLGYAYSQTQFDLNLKPEIDSVSIAYTIVPGDLSQFGETTIDGNKYIKEKYIRRQLNYKADDRYNLDLLDKTRQQLYNLQLFKVVSVSPQTDPVTRRNPIPVQLHIEEMPRWMTKFGVGWGTEDKFRAFADVTYRGLFGGTSRLNLYVKHSALTPYHVSLSWIEPQFFLKKLSLTVNPYIKREKEPGYDVQRLGLNIPVNYVFTDHLSASLSFYYERVKQFDVSGDSTLVEIVDPESNHFLYNKSGLQASVMYTTARPVISPVRGGSITLGGKVNGYLFGGDFDYTKIWLDARKYQRLGGFIIAGRGMIGAIHSSNNPAYVPVEDRFYSGGSNSNRGWARSEIGPERADGTPIGGSSILEMNLEVRHKLFWQVELAAFMDVSHVWTQSYHYRFNELSYGAGGGVRVNTPIGPVRFDVGVPLWNEKKSVQFFLSVGQAF